MRSHLAEARAHPGEAASILDDGAPIFVMLARGSSPHGAGVLPGGSSVGKVRHGVRTAAGHPPENGCVVETLSAKRNFTLSGFDRVTPDDRPGRAGDVTQNFGNAIPAVRPTNGHSGVRF